MAEMDLNFFMPPGMAEVEVAAEKGGKNSGHHGHAGRPGKRGGSTPSSGGVSHAVSNAGNPYQQTTQMKLRGRSYIENKPGSRFTKEQKSRQNFDGMLLNSASDPETRKRIEKIFSEMPDEEKSGWQGMMLGEVLFRTADGGKSVAEMQPGYSRALTQARKSPSYVEKLKKRVSMFEAKNKPSRSGAYSSHWRDQYFSKQNELEKPRYLIAKTVLAEISNGEKEKRTEKMNQSNVKLPERLDGDFLMFVGLKEKPEITPDEPETETPAQPADNAELPSRVPEFMDFMGFKK